MNKCESCGNTYSKMFTIKMFEHEHTFDCFECAISALAPRCNHCATPIIGHGVEAGDLYFCCAHCSRSEGHPELRDHMASQLIYSEIR